MIVTALPSAGNSSKFKVITKKSEFLLALSHTLRIKTWKLADATAELEAAQELAEAVVSRHDPALPFQPLYIFAEHNCEPSIADTVKRIRKDGYRRKKV